MRLPEWHKDVDSDGQCMVWEYGVRCTEPKTYEVVFADGSTSDCCVRHAAEARAEFDIRRIANA